MAKSGRTRGTGGGAPSPHGGGAVGGGGGLSGFVAEAAGGIREGTSSIISSIQGIVGQMQQFVQALSPSTVQMFGQAIKDLHATIGQAFQPAFVALAGVVRQIADQISPLMQELAPVIRQVAQFLGEKLVAGLHAVVGVFEAIVPVVQTLFDALSPLADAMQSLSGALAGVLAAALVPLVAVIQAARPIIDGVVKAFQELIRNLILASVHFLKMVGWMAAIDSIVKSLSPQEGGRVLAAGPTQITGLEEVVKQLATSAAQARGEGGAAVSKEDEFRNELLAQVKEAKGNGVTLLEFLTRSFIPEMAKAIADAIMPKTASGALEGVGVPHSAASVAGAPLAVALNPVGSLLSWFTPGEKK